MKPLMIVGVLLIVLGGAGLLYGGITYSENSENIDLGVANITVQEKNKLNVHPAIGGLLLVAGVVVVAASKKQG